jgi:hypothetical protein
MHIDDSQMIVEGSNSHLRINAAPIIVSRYRLFNTDERGILHRAECSIA